ncbi:MAG: hypothetical protein ACE14T_01855 [Syntrophales bacterium]
MKRLILAVLICVAMVSMAYGQELKDITSAAKEKTTGIAKEQATAIVDDTTITTKPAEGDYCMLIDRKSTGRIHK